MLGLIVVLEDEGRGVGLVAEAALEIVPAHELLLGGEELGAVDKVLSNLVQALPAAVRQEARVVKEEHRAWAGEDVGEDRGEGAVEGEENGLEVGDGGEEEGVVGSSLS